MVEAVVGSGADQKSIVDLVGNEMMLDGYQVLLEMHPPRMPRIRGRAGLHLRHILSGIPVPKSVIQISDWSLSLPVRVLAATPNDHVEDCDRQLYVSESFVEDSRDHKEYPPCLGKCDLW